MKWSELKEFVNSLDEKQLLGDVYFIENVDDGQSCHVGNAEVLDEDVYANIEDNHDVGTLRDLREAWDDTDGEFDESNYEIVTHKGTPFLWGEDFYEKGDESNS